jgi:hypothetical protein
MVKPCLHCWHSFIQAHVSRQWGPNFKHGHRNGEAYTGHPEADNNALWPVVLLEIMWFLMFPGPWQSKFRLVHSVGHDDQCGAVHTVWGCMPKDIMYITVGSNGLLVITKVFQRCELVNSILSDSRRGLRCLGLNPCMWSLGHTHSFCFNRNQPITDWWITYGNELVWHCTSGTILSVHPATDGQCQLYLASSFEHYDALIDHKGCKQNQIPSVQNPIHESLAPKCLFFNSKHSAHCACVLWGLKPRILDHLAVHTS